MRLIILLVLAASALAQSPPALNVIFPDATIAVSGDGYVITTMPPAPALWRDLHWDGAAGFADLQDGSRRPVPGAAVAPFYQAWQRAKQAATPAPPGPPTTAQILAQLVDLQTRYSSMGVLSSQISTTTTAYQLLQQQRSVVQTQITSGIGKVSQ